MPPRTKPERRTARPVTITAVVDPVAALASGNLDENLYLYDTNRTEGSTGFGTPGLRTRVRKGDTLLWNVLPLECETYVAIADVEIDPRIAEPERRVYPGTDIVFWTATVKQDSAEPVEYRLSFLLGAVTEPYTAKEAQALVVGRANAGKERK
ncbi:hypothetical protein GCM10009678_90680 [Actinomadura kijaniata]|uniref:Uncharacterized protein n=1 Tax=Actinomadura namibiensis TaxID=182080 RepID=A0A7W3LT74_ACTNM|nr:MULTISPECIES: hypothetical protein [Actinomadura]MBA8953760.1 hypothetical protein [Actinomadura namibiensis]